MSPAAARIDVQPLDLRLRHRFTIARSSEDVSHTLILRLFARGLEALGEVMKAMGDFYYGGGGIT